MAEVVVIVAGAVIAFVGMLLWANDGHIRNSN
jgi:hypothetical protein